METDEDGSSGELQSLGDNEGTSLTGRHEPYQLQCQLDLDEARHYETRLPISDEDSTVMVKAASEDVGMGGGMVQSDAPEKDQIFGEVAEAREVGTVEDDEANGGVKKQEVKVANLFDGCEEATETNDVAGRCVDNQAREIECLDDTKRKGGNVNGDRVEYNMVATVEDGNALARECCVCSVDKVAEEKELENALTGVPHMVEEEVILDVMGMTYEMKSSAAGNGGSIDMVGKVANEKDLDEVVGEVPHLNLDGTEIRYNTESSVPEHAGSTTAVSIAAKEKDLDEPVVEVPQIAEEEVILDKSTTRDEFGSAASVDMGGMVTKEKESDAAAGEVLLVAAEQEKDWEVIGVGVDAKDDEMVKADETIIDTRAAGLDNVSNMALETNETKSMEYESGKVDEIKQADDTAMEMEKRKSEMVGDGVQVKEEVNRMSSEAAAMESEVRGVHTAVEKSNNVDIVEEIKEVNNEVGNDMLENPAEVEDRGAEIEITEQGTVVGVETADAEEDADGSCMVEETMKGEDADGSCMVEESMKGEDAEVAYEADDMDKEADDMDGEADDLDEEADAADVMEEDVDADEAERTEESEERTRSSAIGKRKRGKNSKGSGRAPSKRKIEEDVCFICFDGGELVLCDRRGCPKAYHPSCVNRDEAFFRSKGRWNCGWHLCSNCEKNAYYMCYTCTFSLCKGCVKDAVILCVRGNKGFCETCMRTVLLIEQKEQGNKEMQGQVNSDDKSSWEYIFKDYWMDLKSRLSLMPDELARAKNPWKGLEPLTTKESLHEGCDANKHRGSDSDNSCGNIESKNSRRRKPKKRLKSRNKDGDFHSTVTREGSSADGSFEWASKELLEFVIHMWNGDKSFLSQFDVQALLLEYIKRNKLRDPQRKSQIICDARLQNLFGKTRVGHFEMLKLLESHFLLKEDSQVEDLQESIVDTKGDRNSESVTKPVKDKKRKTRKNRGLQSNLDDYAAIDTHNINLIYLKRKLAEELIENTESFQDKVVGSFARIRISAGGQKQELYRLVQVVGTCKGTEPYKLGKMMTNTLLEILNLNKKEVIPIDIISNQEFTEDECKRLRQSIRCGLINRLTVGDVREKAMALQEVRVKDWLEAEILRVSHLRDRASDMGRRKELRECVEKLQILKASEERQRRLEEIPEIHADPNMDPSYESEEDEVRQENNMKPRSSGFSRRGREPISPQKSGGPQSDTWNGTRNHSNANRELNRSMSNKGFSRDVTDVTSTSDMGHDSPRKRGREMDRESRLTNSWEKPKLSSSAEISSRNSRPVLMSGPFSSVSESTATQPSTPGVQPAAKINETEKMWHYKDPSGKVQGPFSMVQLRKWSNTGYFPADLRIWKSGETQDDSILLTDVLAGKFPNHPSFLLNNEMVQDSHPSSSYSGKRLRNVEAQLAERSQLVQSGGSWNSGGDSPGRPALGNRSSNDNYSLLAAKPASLSTEVPKNSTNEWGSDHARKSELMNLPSTPQSKPGGIKAQAFENIWGSSSGHSSTSMLGMSAISGVAKSLPSTAAVSPDSAGQFLGNASLNSLPTAPVSTPFLANTSLNPVLLQNLVQSMSNYNNQAQTKGWGSPLVSKPELATSMHGGESKGWVNVPPQRIEQNAAVTPAQWDSTTSVQNPNFYSGNTTGTYSAACFPGTTSTDTWRQHASISQSTAQPPGAANLQWGVGGAHNQSNFPRPVPENQNMAWGVMQGNQNMGWPGPVPTNWLPGQLPASSNVNPGWAAPMQGSSAVGAMPGRTGPTQGQPQISANPGWVTPGQGPPPANTNSGWNPTSTNPNMWVGEQSHGGYRYTNTGDRVPHGEYGYGGSQPWNRQSSFNDGGGGGGPGNSFQRSESMQVP